MSCRPLVFLTSLLVLLLTSCQRVDQSPASQAMTLESFTKVYNDYIARWLQDSIETKRQELTKNPEKARVLNQELEVLTFRQGLGDYLNFAEPSTIPKNLKWKTGLEQKEFADPKAKRGGTFFSAIGSFPPTLRWFGSNSNGGFRSQIFDDVNIRLVDLHPVTGQLIPGLAKKWAVSADGKTIYFELYPDITYTDGSPLEALDFHRSIFVMGSDYVSNPYSKQFFREEFAQVTVYGSSHLAVTLPEAKPLAPWKVADDLFPSPKAFYAEYGPDFEDRYQWRAVPHTGAYHILDGDFVKGASLKQTRVQNWWGDDKPFLRHRFNPDFIHHTVIRDPSKVFELFKIGKVDLHGITIPEDYYEKSEIPAVFDGYVEKATFYHTTPQIPRGFFLNLSQDKLKDIHFRLGLHHAMNWEKVIRVVHRGDYSRLQQFYQGYGKLTNQKIKARPFSIKKARSYFKKAGYTKENSEGLLVNKDGEPLSIVLNYTENPYYTKMFKILKSEAKKVGLNLILDAQEGSVSFKTTLEKKYEMTFSGWGVSPPFPYYYQFFHSDNAYDKEGNPKPYTNNINCYAKDRMDDLCLQARKARSLQRLQEVSMEAQQLIHDDAIFIPSYALNFYRVAYWRWVQWPNTDHVTFSVPLKYDPMELHLHWIDTAVKDETLKARREKTTFPEAVHVYDQYLEKRRGK